MHLNSTFRNTKFLQILLICLSNFSNVRSQTIISLQDFETTPATPTMTFNSTGGTIGAGTIGGTGLPSSTTPYGVSGTRGYRARNETATFVSNAINTNCFSSPFLTFRLEALSSNGSNGIDGTDIVTVSISTDGTTFSDEMTISGNASTANAYWSYTTGTGTAASSYDGNNTIEGAKAWSPAGGAARTTDGYSTVRLNNLPNSSTLYIRITMLNNANQEIWAIDNVILNSASAAITQPSAPSITNGSRCGPGTVNLSASGAGGSQDYKWYDVLTGGVASQTGGATYTTPSISATTTYYATVYNTTLPSCESSPRTSVFATVNTAPSASVVSPTSVTICNGSIQTLTGTATGVSSPITATQGAGGSTSAASSVNANLGPNPFQSYYGGSKQQMLIRASELTALGMSTSGSIINDLGIYMANVDGNALLNVTIKMQNTTLTALTSAVVSTGWTTVYTTGSLTPTTGVNNFTLTSPFGWNGTDNLLIEINYSNNIIASGTNRATHDATSYVSTWFYRADSQTAATMNGYSATVSNASFIYSSRNRMRFIFQNYLAPTWSSTTGLYTNAGATVPYAGTALGTVYAKPTTTTTYTATVTYNGICPVTSTSIITVDQLPTASAGGVISAFVGEYLTVSGATATNGTIQWTHDGTGIFDETYFPINNDETTTPTYYTEADDFGQTVTLTMTVTGLGACSASTATANFTINVDGRPALWTYQCGTTLADINDYVYAYAYPGATQYRFRINDGTNSYTFDTPASVFYFPQFGTQEYGTTYTCDVACFVGGSWTAFGPTCSITTPILPVTQIQSSQCGTVLSSVSTPIYADLVIGASQYRFRVFDGVTTHIIDNNSRLFLLTQLPTYTYGTTYTIDVSVDYGGFQPYGSTCTITTPAASGTQIEPAFCGSTVADITDLIFAEEVVGATIYRFRVSNGLGTQTIDAPSRVFRLSNLSNVEYGAANTVDVDVLVDGSWIGYGPSCIINTPGSSLPEISAVHCGSTLTDITDLIYADEITGATIYRFRVSNGLGVQTIDAPSRVFRLSNLTNIEYNAVNTVDVDAFVDGAWIGYGPTCLITSPLETPTNLAASYCNYTIISSSELIFADERPGATTYRYRLIEGIDTFTVDKPFRIFRITDVLGVLVNTTYSVDVDVLINGVWTGFGATCDLTTPSTLVFKNSNFEEITFKDTFTPLQFLGIESNNENPTNIKLSAFPNPFKDNFELTFDSNSTENIEVQIFDATGKQIEYFSLTFHELEGIKFGQDYTQGIYFISLKQNEFLRHIKVVKN
ncbi:MAG: T9SS type A sorting domain-containing protein [Flavobacteriia bacterium]